MADDTHLSGDALLAAAQGGDAKDIQAAGGGNPNPDDDNKDKDKPNPGADNGEGGGSKGSGGSDDGGSGGDGGDGGDQGPSQEAIQAVQADLESQFESFKDEKNTDAQALKKDLLAMFEGGEDFNEAGDVVDKDGKVIASYDELVKKIAAEPEAKFDAAGNEVDDDGKIIRTAHEIKVEASEVNQIAKELGYEIRDDQEQIKLYPEGNTGLKELINDVVAQETLQNQKDFFDQNPVLREVSKHLLAGGDLEDFQKPVDYTQVDIKTLSKENKKNYIKQSYLAEGVSEERAANIVEGIEEAKLDASTQEALDVLDAKEKERETAREEALQRQADKRAEDNRRYWENVKSVVTAGDLDGFKVPEKDRVAFFQYLAVPVKDGLSQDMLDKQARQLPAELKEAYYRFKGYDVSDAVREQVGTSRVLSIRERLKKTSNQDTTHNPKPKGNDKAIDYDAIYANQ